jgi:hypothetical protein
MGKYYVILCAKIFLGDQLWNFNKKQNFRRTAVLNTKVNVRNNHWHIDPDNRDIADLTLCSFHSLPSTRTFRNFG